MEENHLEYGYLEGESIGGHFAEDPVGVTVLYILWPTHGEGEKKRVSSRFCFVRTSVARAKRRPSHRLAPAAPAAATLL